jgi:hypothetical protein
VVIIVNDWIDSGMKGPIPWPSGNPFFDRWAKENGFDNCEGFVGFKLQMKLGE